MSSFNSSQYSEEYMNSSKSNFGYNTNNKFANYPPLMSDGRALVASWQSSSFVDNKYKNDNKINTNWEYRKYLTVNANQIIKEEYQNSLTDQGYYTKYPFDEDTEPPTTPKLYSSFYENVYPIGRENTDLKSIYLSKEQLNSQKITPQINM
jgi:hypothetical protein